MVVGRASEGVDDGLTSEARISPRRLSLPASPAERPANSDSMVVRDGIPPRNPSIIVDVCQVPCGDARLAQ